MLYHSESWLWGFKVELFPLQSDIYFTFLYLIVGVGSRVLVIATSENQ